MKKNYYYSFVLLAMLGMASPQSAFADNEGIHAAKAVQQAKKVTGKVMTATGEPVIGAAVLVKGTTNGTVTDLDGNFQINAELGNILEISYIGYETFLVKVGAGNNYNVTLQEDAETLDEVVVTAMGIKKERKALGYAVSDLKSEELMKNKNTNVVNSLAGKVPGVNITQSSGAAGAGASITIRGGNSTSEGRENQPLFVVDGIIYDNSTQVTGNSGYGGETRSSTTYSNRVMDINPEDIENMSVLKGAAAAALYGSRAADGVIIITTKKGAEGSVKVDVNSKLSTSFAGKTPEAQTVFGRGSYSTNGVLSETTYSQWGEKIAAGTPILADENVDSYFPVPAEMVPNGQPSFVLKVKGDSMINVGIYHGDQIFVQSCSTARDGDTVVALIDDSATVKTFYKEKDHIRLQPETHSMDPIIVDDCQILGRVFGVFRMYH